MVYSITRPNWTIVIQWPSCFMLLTMQNPFHSTLARGCKGWVQAQASVKWGGNTRILLQWLRFCREVQSLSKNLNSGGWETGAASGGPRFQNVKICQKGPFVAGLGVLDVCGGSCLNLDAEIGAL